MSRTAAALTAALALSLGPTVGIAAAAGTPAPPNAAKLKANRVKFDDGRVLKIRQCTVESFAGARATYTLVFPEGVGIAIKLRNSGDPGAPSVVVLGDGGTVVRAKRSPVTSRDGLLWGTAKFAKAETPFALAYKLRLSSCHPHQH